MISPNYASSLFAGINFHNPSWDAFILLFWIIVSVIYSFAAGRGRIISILVAVYMSELIVIQAPFIGTAAAQQLNVALYLGRLIAFLAMFLIFFLVLSKYVFRTSVEHRGISSWIFSLAFSILQVGFLISVVLSFLPSEVKGDFSPLIKVLFVSQVSQFVWLLLPIAFLVFAGRFRRVDATE